MHNFAPDTWAHAAELEKITQHSLGLRNGGLDGLTSLPQMLDQFASGAHEVQLWLEAAKVFLDSLDPSSPTASGRQCQEFDAMISDFTPTIELLCELGGKIQHRVDKIQASLPDDERYQRDEQAAQAHETLKAILAEWKTVNVQFSTTRHRLLEAQYADELYQTIAQAQTDIRQYVGSVQAFERQWAATHAPLVTSPASIHSNSPGSADPEVVPTSRALLGYKTDKIQRQEDHALARLHQQVGSFEPRLQQLKDRVTRFCTHHPLYRLPTHAVHLSFEVFYESVLTEWIDLNQYLAQLKRRMLSERWVYIYEDLSDEITADINTLVALIQSTRSDLIRVKTSATDSQDLTLGIEAVRAQFYSQRKRPFQTVSKLFRHLAARFDKEMLKQRKPALVKQYHALQHSWYEVQEAICHLEAELSHMMGATGSPHPGPSSPPGSESGQSSILEGFPTAPSVASVASSISLLQLDGGKPPMSPSRSSEATSPPGSPALGDNQTLDLSTLLAKSSKLQPPNRHQLVPTGTPMPHRSQATTPGLTQPAPPFATRLPRPKTPGPMGSAPQTRLDPALYRTRKSVDGAMLGIGSRPMSSMDLRRPKTPSMLPRPKTPIRSAATSPTPFQASLNATNAVPLPALPVFQKSPPDGVGRSRPLTPGTPSVASRWARTSAIDGHSRHGTGTAAHGKPPMHRPRPKTPSRNISFLSRTEPGSPRALHSPLPPKPGPANRTPGSNRSLRPSLDASDPQPPVVENGLINMDLLLQRSKAPTHRHTNLYTPSKLLSPSLGARHASSPSATASRRAASPVGPSGSHSYSLSQTLANSNMNAALAARATVPRTAAAARRALQSPGPAALGRHQLINLDPNLEPTASPTPAAGRRTRRLSGSADSSTAPPVRIKERPRSSLYHVVPDKSLPMLNANATGPHSPLAHTPSSLRMPVTRSSDDGGEYTAVEDENIWDEAVALNVVLSDLPHYEPVDSNDPLDQEISDIVNRSPVPTPVYRVEPGKYYFGADSAHEVGIGKLVLCRLRNTHVKSRAYRNAVSPTNSPQSLASVGSPPRLDVQSGAGSDTGSAHLTSPSKCAVLVRVGGGWQDLDVFLLDLSLSNVALGTVPSYRSQS
ncbi:hypothetical protein H4R34_001222 [Dimargaris verticillata]|uniref:GAR domain-containing protein n=1 Tax=Dimargaris verticillata TaxID=2761393 RepID=A0A9W8B404_9FUNG|nr:hypothetical protein H4R34_001222 [Dimargaris verticillata]